MTVRHTLLTARVALLVLLCALAAAPSSARAQASGGLSVELRSVSAAMPLRSDSGTLALEVYRSLLPKGVDLPAEPAVGVWLAELSVGGASARPMDEASHWIEGAIELRARVGKEDGWYPIHYPVTAEFWFNAGRAVGLPKRHAAASITPDGNGWKAVATPRGATGEPSIAMDFHPGAGGDAHYASLAFSTPLDPLFALNAPLKGPDLERVQYLLDAPSPVFAATSGAAPYSKGYKPTSGLVDVRLRPDLDALQESDLPKLFGTHSLADLVEPVQTATGTYSFVSASLNSDSKVIGQGSYPAPPLSAPTQGSSAPPKAVKSTRRGACASHRVVVMAVRGLHPGMTTVRATANGRRVPARILDRRHVRVSLRALPRGRYRVTVVAHTARHKAVKRSAVYRTCAPKSRAPHRRGRR